MEADALAQRRAWATRLEGAWAGGAGRGAAL